MTGPQARPSSPTVCASFAPSPDFAFIGTPRTSSPTVYTSIAPSPNSAFCLLHFALALCASPPRRASRHITTALPSISRHRTAMLISRATQSLYITHHRCISLCHRQTFITSTLPFGEGGPLQTVGEVYKASSKAKLQ